MVSMLFLRGYRRHSSISRIQNVPILEKVEFLGHVVSADDVSVQTIKINSVRDWPAPTSITES